MSTITSTRRANPMNRPDNYKYKDIICEYFGNNTIDLFNNNFRYPRQFELHLPGDHIKSCNFQCIHCQGREIEHNLSNWEAKGLALIEKLRGIIPYYIFAGTYTEPLLNKYLSDFLRQAKAYNNNFGIHTNGSLLNSLEDSTKLCTLICDLATSPNDYVSISLDSGSTQSHKKTKNTTHEWFTETINGIKRLISLRKNKTPAVRVCYLLNEHNSSKEEIKAIVQLMKNIGVDSLRFSIPYDSYGKQFQSVKEYRDSHEIPFGEKCKQIVAPYLSCNNNDSPYIFWHSRGYQDVNKMNFQQCIYGYYQITCGADGWIYKCPSTASPSFKENRLGKLTDDVIAFKEIVSLNQNLSWNATTCFEQGARCNRTALELNHTFHNDSLFSETIAK